MMYGSDTVRGGFVMLDPSVRLLRVLLEVSVV